MRADLTAVIVVFVAIVVVSMFLSRRSRRMGGEDRAQRRRESLATNPTMRREASTTGGKRFVTPFSTVTDAVADVARDSVDHAGTASSDDLDLLARRPDEAPPSPEQ